MLLANKFADDFCRQNNIEFKGFDDSAIKIFEQYTWPGNVRELKNLIESIIVLEKGNRIDNFVLNKYLNYQPQEERNLPIPLNKTTEQAEREFLYRALLDLKNEISQLREIILTKLFPPKRLKPWEHLEPLTYGQDNHEILYEDTSEETPPAISLQEMERDLIESTLRKYNGNKRKTAKSLEISERTLYRKIKEYGLPF
jgi:DNA-binding NtrC family response regulator